MARLSISDKYTHSVNQWVLAMVRPAALQCAHFLGVGLLCVGLSESVLLLLVIYRKANSPMTEVSFFVNGHCLSER